MTPSTTRWASALLLASLAACAGAPPPDWQSNAHGALKGFTASYLSGDGKAAEAEFVRARGEIASTGRLDLMARAELLRCATRLASLELDSTVAGLDPLLRRAQARRRRRLPWSLPLTSHATASSMTTTRRTRQRP